MASGEDVIDGQQAATPGRGRLGIAGRGYHLLARAVPALIFSVAFGLPTAWGQSPPTPADVVWNHARGVVISGNSLTKFGISGWGNSGASSVQAILSGDGWLEFSTNETNLEKLCGLARRDPDRQYEPIDFALWLTRDSEVGVVEKGNVKGWFGAYHAGDVFRLSVAKGAVSYLKNGALMYTSAAPASYPLMADAALNDDGATLMAAMIGGSSLGANVGWTNTVGVSAVGSSLEKTTSISDWDAGAVSTRALDSGDGYVEMVARETTTSRILGLSSGDAGAGDADVDFGIYLVSDGTARIIEQGALRTDGSGSSPFTTYATGDRLRVAVEGGLVRYRKNGTLLYTSGVLPVYPLLVDASLRSTGATVGEVVLSGSLVQVGVDGPELAAVSGNAASGFDVLVTTGTAEAEIRYSTNGADPTESAALVPGNGVIHLGPGTTLKAKAWKPGLFPSRVETRSFGEWSDPPVESVTWTHVVGATANGGNLSKTAPDGWGNAGAISTRALASGDGFVEFTVPQEGPRWVAGLSNGDTNQTDTDVDFGFYVNTQNRLHILEQGGSRTQVTFVAGDRLRVAVEAGVVRYRWNGTLVYQSAVAPTYPLVLDSAVHSASAMIADAVISGTFVPLAPPSVSINDVMLAEGNTVTPNATFTASLSAPHEHLVTVDYVTGDGTAMAASDYVAANGTVYFHPGETTKAIPVTVNGDITIETNETFVVNLGNPVGVTLGDAQGQATITNDDADIIGALTCPGVIAPGTVFTTTVTGGNSHSDWVAMYPAGQSAHHPWLGPYRQCPYRAPPLPPASPRRPVPEPTSCGSSKTTGGPFSAPASSSSRRARSSPSRTGECWKATSAR